MTRLFQPLFDATQRQINNKILLLGTVQTKHTWNPEEKARIIGECVLILNYPDVHDIYYLIKQRGKINEN